MKIGKLQFNHPIVLAPMENVSNTPFRLMSRRMGADIVYTEFTSSEALIRDAQKALKKIAVTDDERPIAIQIYGGVEESMEKAARIAEEQNPDFIDINCGCWVKNHALRGEGAGLLRDLKKFETIVQSTISGTRLPVTVKTRLGWDEKNIVILDIARMLEQNGVQALTIHCRTRCQGYKGEADWSWIEKIKKVTSIPVIGNGDVTSPEDVKKLFEMGCDGVMIGRGAIGNPWIFKQSKHYRKTGALLPDPTIEEKIQQCLAHLNLSVQYFGLRHGVIVFRKYYSGYLNGLPNVAKLRADLMQLVDLAAIQKRLSEFLDQQAFLPAT